MGKTSFRRLLKFGPLPFLLVSLAFSASCSLKKKSPSTAAVAASATATPTATPTPTVYPAGTPDAGILNTWETVCDGSVQSRTLINFNVDLSMQIRALQGSAPGICNDQAEIRVTGDYTTPSGSTVVDGATNLNMHLVHIYLTPLNDAQTAAWIAANDGAGMCGLTSWVKNTEVDVTALTGEFCYPGLAGETIYSLYKIIDGSFFLGVQSGDTDDGSSEPNRNTGLDLSTPFSIPLT